MLAFVACNHPEEKAEQGLEKSFAAIELVDTFQFETEILSKPHSKVSSYSPLYLGPLKYRVEINYTLSHVHSVPPPPQTLEETESELFSKTREYRHEVNRPFRKDDSDWTDTTYFKLESPDNDKFWSETQLDIYVDTSQRIRHIDMGYITQPMDRFAFEAFPVIIYNPTEKYSTVGKGSNINLLLEFQNKNSEWDTIEKTPQIFCDFGVPDLVIPPDELAISSIAINPNLENIRLRLRLGKNVSNEFSFD
jgi:hypothetical protein